MQKKRICAHRCTACGDSLIMPNQGNAKAEKAGTK